MQGWPGCLAKVEWLVHMQSLIPHGLLFCAVVCWMYAVFLLKSTDCIWRAHKKKKAEIFAVDYHFVIIYFLCWLINLLLILVTKAFKCSGASGWAQVVLHVVVIIDLIHCNSTNLTSDLLCLVRSKVFDDDFGCCKGQKWIIFCKGKCRSQKGLHYFVQKGYVLCAAC